MLIDFKDDDFENKIKNEDVSVIQFSAAWCGPCKALKPVMDKLSDEYKEKASFYYGQKYCSGFYKIEMTMKNQNNYLISHGHVDLKKLVILMNSIIS